MDCLDEPGVFEDIGRIRSLSQTPIDLHLITDEPGPYQPLIEQYGVEWVCYQYEKLKSPKQIEGKTSWQQGLAIVSDTPIESFEAFQESCSFVLFMATTPGKSGGRFHPHTFRRIQQFRLRYPGVRIHVDGGVTSEVSFILRNMGVSTIVSGSYLLNGNSIATSMLHLKTEQADSAFRVEDFMIGLEGTPLLEMNTSVLNVLQTIERYQHGLVMIADENRKLQGLITNADIRRALLRHPHDFNQITVEELINPHPLIAYGDLTLTELLREIRNASISVNYLPVIDRNRRVIGLLTFRDLIKGE